MFKRLMILALGATGTLAHASAMYEITITNTSMMPISPGVIYIDQGQGGQSEAGQEPTPGFVTLCQTGNPSTKAVELKGKVAYVAQTPGPVLPGKSITVEIPMPTSKTQSVHFEAMYGKSKDTCASISIPAHRLGNGELIGRDEVVSTGAFTEPDVPAYATNVCDKAAAAVDCLRLLASPRIDGQISYFPGYLPSVLTYLEGKYGAGDVQTLLIPTSGAVHYRLKMK